MAPASPEDSSALRRLLGPGSRLGLVAAIAAAVVAVDQVTKLLAVQFLEGEDRIEILGGLVQLQFFRNFAGPNNLFGGHTVLISVFAILAVIVLLVIAFRISTTAAAIAVGLLLGGALGNLIDRIVREPSPLHGGVVDWLKLTSLSKSMNVADLAIDAAVVVMLVTAVLAWWRDREDERRAQGEPRAGER
ncbi:MAG TPA: signal peptidase II [Solirubrobacterales bacterium]|nr:signal peptidase II [Solirubrobacterales bacterium]